MSNLEHSINAQYLTNISHSVQSPVLESWANRLGIKKYLKRDIFNICAYIAMIDSKSSSSL